jgi:hypothetical protein
MVPGPVGLTTALVLAFLATIAARAIVDGIWYGLTGRCLGFWTGVVMTLPVSIAVFSLAVNAP